MRTHMGKYISRKKTRKRKRKTTFRKRTRKTRIRKRRRKTSFRKRRRKTRVRKRRKRTRRYSGGADDERGRAQQGELQTPLLALLEGAIVQEGSSDEEDAAGAAPERKGALRTLLATGGHKMTDWENALRALLAKKGLDTSMWGKDGNKTVKDLLKEVLDGECTLKFGPSGNVQRIMTGVAVLKIFKSPQKKVVLNELLHLNNADPPKITRIKNLNTYMMEKMGPGESPDDAVKRGVKEELDGGVPNGPFWSAMKNFIDEKLDSKIGPTKIDQATNETAKDESWIVETLEPARSYPGLMTYYTRYSFGAILDANDATIVATTGGDGASGFITTEYKYSYKEGEVVGRTFKRQIEWEWAEKDVRTPRRIDVEPGYCDPCGRYDHHRARRFRFRRGPANIPTPATSRNLKSPPPKPPKRT